MTNLVINVPGEYVSLGLVMQSALEQASKGKGRERHASEGEAYEDQIICEVARRVGLGYPLGQAVKKVYEAQRLGGERGVAELLGALNYIAAAVIVMKEEAGSSPAPQDGDELVMLWKHKRPEGKFAVKSYADEFFKAEGNCFQNGNSSTKAEGCEELVQDEPSEVERVFGTLKKRPAPEYDAPQTPQELYQHIVDCNPATYGRPRKPTGEELAEMAEEDA